MSQKEQISIGEHMLRTQEQMKKIMDLSIIVIPQLFENVRLYKQRKKERELLVKEDVDWNTAGTEQDLGTSKMFL